MMKILVLLGCLLSLALALPVDEVHERIARSSSDSNSREMGRYPSFYPPYPRFPPPPPPTQNQADLWALFLQFLLANSPPAPPPVPT
ncbi:unnamed protein product [Gadus morhua 'NCC']